MTLSSTSCKYLQKRLSQKHPVLCVHSAAYMERAKPELLPPKCSCSYSHFVLCAFVCLCDFLCPFIIMSSHIFAFQNKSIPFQLLLRDCNPTNDVFFFSPRVSLKVRSFRFRTVVNDVTPPNFCSAHFTSSSFWVGKSSLVMFRRSLSYRTIGEVVFIWRVKNKAITSVQIKLKR